MAMIIVSAIISAITSKIVATYYFEKADGYVAYCEAKRPDLRSKTVAFRF